MRPLRVTTWLLLVAVVLIGCFFRGLVDVYRLQFRPPTILPTKAALDQARNHNANDAGIGLGYAVIAAQRRQWQGAYEMWRKELPSYKPEPGWNQNVAFAEAVRLAPGDPTPRLYYALSLLKEAGLHSPAYPDKPDARWRPTTRTAKERQALEQVRGLLTEAAASDPQNAFVRYLLAYVGFAGCNDATAYREIARAEQCQHWTRHQDKIGVAVWRTLDASGASPVSAAADAMNTAQAAPIPANSVLRVLAVLLQWSADERRRAGDDEAALGGYGSILKLARTIRIHATDTIELLVGQALVRLATARLLPPKERQQLIRAKRDDAWIERLHIAEAEAFAAYARQHGRPELATLAVTETQAYTADGKQLRAALDRTDQRLAATVARVATTAFRPMLCQAALLLAVLTLLGLMRLLPSAKWRPPVVWMPVGLWIGSLVGLVALPVVASACYVAVKPTAPSEAMQGFYLLLVYAVAIGAGGGWLLLVGLRIRRQAEELDDSDRDQRHSVSGKLFLFVLSALAAQFLFLVLLLVMVYLAALHDNHLAMNALTEGRLHALGLR
ncbi:MAG: hypothetical protein ACYC63_17720 [Armatimonadota bacterium]